ncbi:DUF3892 domain-containing protein [Sulfitobacter sp. R18_1]|uniref:DUF3892 domain-containing protein n=1 Tax=Sulfitobacter sp. R18_1 TaxID=2821104 RepID=UPI001ADA311F|nr:DUF3892 domain-containing protein [Sulfitobacter sp. R18_1]MBO9431614.1 DUF3892 domain-containing protein [Sulfitobacter sp. R18_1]
MTYTAQIRCINKTDRDSSWERITHVGGVNSDGTRWRQTQEQTIREIEDRSWEFYVEVRGDRVDVVVATSRYGNKYIKTVADGDQPNNLLSLPECP